MYTYNIQSAYTTCVCMELLYICRKGVVIKKKDNWISILYKCKILIKKREKKH